MNPHGMRGQAHLTGDRARTPEVENLGLKALGQQVRLRGLKPLARLLDPMLAFPDVRASKRARKSRR